MFGNINVLATKEKCMLKNVVLCLMMLLFSLTSFADSIRCDSPTVLIQGVVQARYLRMGKSHFSGNVLITIYRQRKIVSMNSVEVRNGSIQDQSLYFDRETGSNGSSVSLDARNDELSHMEIDGNVVEFRPHCTITPQLQTCRRIRVPNGNERGTRLVTVCN
jgi:hypothetical protein